MSKERTPAQYRALVDSFKNDLLQLTKEELAAELALERVKRVMQNEFEKGLKYTMELTQREAQDVDDPPPYYPDEIETAISDWNQHLLRQYYNTPARRAITANRAAQTKEFWLKLKMFSFLDKQQDIDPTDPHKTQVLAQRLDRELGPIGKGPKAGKQASRGASDAVRDWKKLRSAGKTENAHRRNLPQSPKPPIK